MALSIEPLRQEPASAVQDSSRRSHLVHVFPSFGYGGVPIRIADVISRVEGPFRHSIVALDGRADARSRIASHVEADFPTGPSGKLPGLVPAIARWLKAAQPDLLLTYNWGSIEWALSNRLTTRVRHIHFESGFGPEEADRQLWRRTLFRRLALGSAERLVVPSHLLVRIATEHWRVERRKILLLPNGVDLTRYRPDAGKPLLLGKAREDGRLVVGTVSPLRKEKAIDRLLRAAAPLVREKRISLVIAGDGAERPALEALANDLEIANHTHFLGHVEDVAGLLPLLDIFCLTSDTEQMPNALLQAMAAERPVAAVDVGDVARIVAPENRPFVVPRDNEASFTAALSGLLQKEDQRQALGTANRQRVQDCYDLKDMVAAYGALYRQAPLPTKVPRTP